MLVLLSPPHADSADDANNQITAAVFIQSLQKLLAQHKWPGGHLKLSLAGDGLVSCLLRDGSGHRL
ncbi:MAG: hypothetical protein ACYDAH_17590 [Steroidobacteraceae bacterium]